MDAITSSSNYVGTARLERELTDEERNQLARLLRQHDFVGASLVALRFAYKLTRSRERAGDLMGRANMRLLRLGWNPSDVLLKKRLCRLVWSEHTNESSETEAARGAEESFLDDQVDPGEPRPVTAQRGDPLLPKRPPPMTLPHEHHVIRLEEEREERAAKLAALRGDLAKLRDGFRADHDEVNLAYLEQRLAGIEDPSKLAEAAGLDVADLYAAQKRRKRAIERLRSEKNAAPSGDKESE